MTEETTMRIDLQGEFFEEHIQFLTKIKLRQLSDGSFEVIFPKKFKSKEVFIRHFGYLCWHWYVTTLEAKMQEEAISKGKGIPEYTR